MDVSVEPAGLARARSHFSDAATAYLAVLASSAGSEAKAAARDALVKTHLVLATRAAQLLPRLSETLARLDAVSAQDEAKLRMEELAISSFADPSDMELTALAIVRGKIEDIESARAAARDMFAKVLAASRG